ncbi:transducin/WD40 repeat-like superfamily protein isoform X2 [Wolffia australiana]
MAPSSGGISSPAIQTRVFFQDLRPAAMLCGHTAEIADLALCIPTANPSNENSSCHCLISASINGELCVWTGDSGYCRRRRRLPDWVGTPCIISSLPLSPRYVCLLCYSTNTPLPSSCSYAGWSLEDNVADYTEAERKNHHLNDLKSSVVILDSLSLSAIRVFTHSGFSIGSNPSMGVVPNLENGRKDVLAIANQFGEVILMSLPAEFNEEGEEGTGNPKLLSSETVSSTVSENLLEKATAVSLSECGTLMLLVYSTYFLVKSVVDNNNAEKLDLGESFHLLGCNFLRNEGEEEEHAENLIVWSTDGAAIVFSVKYSADGFDFNRLYEIPASSFASMKSHCYGFSQLGTYLLKLESVSDNTCGSLLWKPQISVWSHFEGSPVANAGSFPEKYVAQWDSNFLSNSQTYYESCTTEKNNIIASSMFLPDDFNNPLTMIAGLYNGDIEEIQLGNARLSLFCIKRTFSGHSGAVLCLAAQKTSVKSNLHCATHILLSGGFDGTVRLWDLDSGDIILIMHHHNAPVRQIILSQCLTYHPWSSCFLSLGEDGCVALGSLDTLNVERMFPGHPSVPACVAWDCVRGYVACLSGDCLYIWDVKTGVRDRVLHGQASVLMFNHFCEEMRSSAPSSFLSLNEDSKNLLSGSKNHVQSEVVDSGRGVSSSFIYDTTGNSCRQMPWQGLKKDSKYPVTCTCPYPGIIAMEFDLSLMMSNEWQSYQTGVNAEKSNSSGEGKFLVEFFLRFSLSLLHLWNIDHEVDKFLVDKMNMRKPPPFLTSGILGNGGSVTLTFPSLDGSLELWKHSAEFSAMCSLTVVSLAQRVIRSSQSCSAAGSELAALYTRKIAEEVPDIKPPLLQLLASFWQDPSEPVRMAARSLFHCAAPRSIPETLFRRSSAPPRSEILFSDENQAEGLEESQIVEWMESFEAQDWVSCVGGTTQDSMASLIIVAAALAVWYPSIVKPKVAELVTVRLVKLVMAMNERYSSTAAELLAEGMDATWKVHIGQDFPHLLGDVFFQVECLNGGSTSGPIQNIRDTLVNVLLPSLAMAEVSGFLTIIESQLSATPSDSTIHRVSLNTLIRVVRGSPRSLVPFIDKVVSYVLHTMDNGNYVLRKNCLQSSMATLREISRAFPMVAFNERSSRLAIGDAIGDIAGATIRIYDLESVTRRKILDATGPPGFPSLLGGGSRKVVAAVISALSFSPDGEGLVAFSEHGLTIRWWPLGRAWWEKFGRSSAPIQCAKLIFVPPWEGFSPSSTRSSIMATISGDYQKQAQSMEPENVEGDSIKTLVQNIDLSYQFKWLDGKNVALLRHGQELGCFQL